MALIQKNWWVALAPREKIIVTLAAALVLLSLLWFLVLRSPLQTWKNAAAERQKIEQQIQQIAEIDAQIQSLQAANRISFDAAYQALTSTTREYFPAGAQISLMGDQVSVTLANANAHTLAQWLAALRNNAKALPESARLNAGTPAAEDSGSSVWSGIVVFRLPPREQ